MVERFNRTLKGRMYRYFTVANTLRYENVLQSLVRGYNATRHRSIGMAPKEVTWKNERAVWKRLYGRLSQTKSGPKLKVGDRVSLNKKHRTFQRGYLPGWTEEVFVVHRIVKGVVPAYKIHQLDDSPYEQDLQKVHVPDDAFFGVEKVLKRKKGQALVKWKGWPDK